MFIAHKTESGEEQSLKDHLVGVAEMAKSFSVPKFKELAYIVGLLHDVGKYQESFQKRINGANIQVEHSGCGAQAAYEKYGKIVKYILASCIAGHHSGIPDGGTEGDTEYDYTLKARLQRCFEDYQTYEKEISLPDFSVNDFLHLFEDEPWNDKYNFLDLTAFITRYIYSCLVDADSLDTEAFCDKRVRTPLKANFQECLDLLNKRFSNFKPVTELQKARKRIQSQVYFNLDNKETIFSLTMPTGSGKTLCSLKFALERALRFNKQRIIYVIPYNSIIDQTAKDFEEMLGESAQILRHQSTFNFDDNIEDESVIGNYRDSAENWDAQFIITTQVQFFESVYSNKRSKLRKLHNISDSIIIFDEVHQMPVKYLKPCLQFIGYACRYLNSQALLMSATMPDFNGFLRRYCNLEAFDLVTDVSDFEYFKKCSFISADSLDDESIVAKAAASPSCLVIVNKRKKAQELYKLADSQGYNAYCLSTYMTVSDRETVLSSIKENLKAMQEKYADLNDVLADERIMVFSTSLIEAGVDLDFFAVFREMNGLDSILQAAGRCNREGKRSCAEVTVFESFNDEEGVVEKQDRIEVACTRSILNRYADLYDDKAVKEFYSRIYNFKEDFIESNSISKHEDAYFNKKGLSLPFQAYRLQFIDNAAESVVVPIDPESQKITEALKYGGKVDFRKLGRYSCSVHKNELEQLIGQGAVKDYGGVYVLINRDYYHRGDHNWFGMTFEAPDYIF